MQPKIDLLYCSCDRIEFKSLKKIDTSSIYNHPFVILCYCFRKTGDRNDEKMEEQSTICMHMP